MKLKISYGKFCAFKSYNFNFAKYELARNAKLPKTLRLNTKGSQVV